MHHDTHIFLEDPWTHWPDKQDEIIRKVPIALGVSELAHLELKTLWSHSDLKRFFFNCSRSGVQYYNLKQKRKQNLQQNIRLFSVSKFCVAAVAVFQICVLFWILILNSQKPNNNFCAGTPPSEPRTDNPYHCRNGFR